MGEKMTIEQFMKNNRIKRKETVIKWIKNDLIPGAILEDDFIPNSARVPYTRARARNVQGVYVSIFNAANTRKHVLPKLYGIGFEEFEHYITQMERAGLIERRITDEITYYDVTINAEKPSRKFILDAIKSVSQGISQGVTTACLEHVMSN